jgi:hypothetical protein
MNGPTDVYASGNARQADALTHEERSNPSKRVRLCPPVSLRHQLPNGSPEVAAHSPSTLPRISVRKSNRIRRVRRSTLTFNRVRARRVEIQLVRRSNGVSWPVARTVHGDVVGRDAVGDRVGDGWIVGGDEVAPGLLESGCEVGAVELARVVEVSRSLLLVI